MMGTGLMAPISRFWAQWPLLNRILAVQGALMFAGVVLFLALVMLQHRGEALEDQEERARLLLLIAEPLVAEQALTGDLASAQQLLERQSVAYADVSKLVWRAPGRDDVGTPSNRWNPIPIAEPVPDWFRAWLDMPSISRSVEVRLGGAAYGDLEVTLVPGRTELGLWQDFLRYAWMSLAAAVVMFVSLILLLRVPLRALRNLSTAAERFGRGEYSVRTVPEGARETRGVALAFNSMAERMQAMVTQLLGNRRQVREQLHFTESLIEALPVPMYYKDEKGNYLSVNKAWEKFFDTPRETIIGHTVADLYPHADGVAAHHQKMDDALITRPGMQAYELEIPMRDGRKLETLYSKATLTDTDGRVIGLIGIITDLSELKAAEHQVHEAMLLKDSAEQASAAKSMFLANMSHEIRTPLTAIIGFSEALLDVNQSMAERIEAIRTINRTGNHLLGIINDILDLSKIEAGKLDVECLPVPVLPLVDDVASLARMQAEGKGLTFALEPEFPLPWTIHSDPMRIKQILLNLVGNAIKFTEKGSVTVRLRHDADNGLLVIEVADTGIGISPEQISRLFQPFSQADATTTRRFGGTGLGLVLSKQLAEKLGGSIVAASVAGQGSRFYASFATGSVGTLIHSVAEAQAAHVPAAIVDEAAPLVGRVLLAEDNPDNQRLIALNMRRVGATLEVVNNGEEAVAAALAESFDLVLMDMQMPVMDGLTAVRLLRAKGYTGKIVALTANATPQDIASCMDAGCDDFLSKPIERSRFAEVMHSYLSLAVEAPLSLVAEMVERDPGLAELMQYFVGRLANDVAILQQLAGNGDLAAIVDKARELRGSAIRYNCRQAADLAGQLEFSASAANADTAHGLIAKLGQLADSIAAELATMPTPGAAAVAESSAPPPATVKSDGAPIVSELMAEGPEMQELVAYFLGRLPGYLTNLQEAAAASDLAAIKKQAHDLKAVGGGYGYPQVMELAIEMEAAAKAEDHAQVVAGVAAFGALAKRIVAGAEGIVPVVEA